MRKLMMCIKRRQDGISSKTSLYSFLAYKGRPAPRKTFFLIIIILFSQRGSNTSVVKRDRLGFSFTENGAWEGALHLYR